MKSEIYNYIQTFKQERPVKRLQIKRLYRYAAVLITAVTAAVLFFSKQKAQLKSQSQTLVAYHTQVGEVKKLLLPDGSACWLNARSTMRISEQFSQAPNRIIYLDEGEAFFKVKHNASQPFIVVTPHLRTRVLGTSFNVKAYEALNKAEVTVATGKVQVNTSNRLLGKITPNQQITYNLKTHRHVLRQVNAAEYQSWATGDFVLRQAPFDELALTMKNAYGVSLVARNPQVEKYRYNLHINPARSLSETLKIICSVHQNTYRRSNNEISIY
nr:FecR family protein [Mucilaginibacter sp. Bleaf8]